MAISEFRVEVYESDERFPGLTRWGIKDRETGQWEELRGIYASAEHEEVSSHCDQLNASQTPESKAERMGRRAGTEAAQWAIEPDRMTKGQMVRVIRGIEAVDPEVIDNFSPPNLSGAGMTPATLCMEMDIDPHTGDGELQTELCDAWEESAREAFWLEIERILRFHLGAE